MTWLLKFYNAFIDTSEVSYCRNVYMDLAGVILPLPFDAQKNGLWRFDGQFFYPKRITHDR